MRNLVSRFNSILGAAAWDTVEVVVAESDESEYDDRVVDFDCDCVSMSSC
jgi:hypothetical protein